MSLLHRMRSPLGVWGIGLTLITLASTAQAIERRSASASPTPTAAADPNLSALSGLAGLGQLPGSPGPNGSGGSCSNQDMLTNFLVYQYLSGSMPNGAPALGSSQGPPTTTVTSVSTTLTTLVVDVEPSTHFMTSTTSYVTTLTSIETKVIPVLFRGSKITTTLTESSEEVITATEYFTDSSVHSPSIVQTLPVHITMTDTSTRGFNGHYTLHDTTPGATSVVHQPINTATLDLDATGLDIGNLDLTQLDLTSLTGGGGGLGGLNLPSGDVDNSEVLSVLSSLLQNYDDAAPPVDEAFDTFPSDGRFGVGRSTSSGRSDNRNFGRQQDFRRSRFQDTFQDDYADYDAPVDDPPKFNVLSGFTLSDRVPSNSGSSSGSGGGRAATDTRYSKYHPKNRVINNGISAADANANDRETEQFSETTSRRTFTRTSGDPRRSKKEDTNRSPSSRFVPSAESQYFEDGPPKARPSGPRSSRHIASRRRPGLTNQRNSNPNTPKAIYSPRQSTPRQSTPRQSRPKSNQRITVPAAYFPEKVRTTILTMYQSGTVPGEFHTSLRTVTLRSLPSRRRRDVQEDQTATIASTKTASLRVTENSVMPDLQNSIDHEVNPSDVVHLLKSLDSTQVKKMLKSLRKWVDYYSHEILGEDETPAKDVSDSNKNNIQVPELASSISTDDTEKETKATTELPLSPSSVAEVPKESVNYCLPPPTVTETVYRTFIVTSGSSAA